MANKHDEIEKVQIKQETDAAWQRLMNALEQESQNDYWAQADRSGGMQALAQAVPQEGFAAYKGQKEFIQAQGPAVNEGAFADAGMKRENATSDSLPAPTPSRPRRGRRARKWIALAAAAAVAVTVVITPAGNQALASILGQFRMEQVTEVNEKDMEQLFNSVFQSGISEQEINRFGTFTVETGKDLGEMSVTEATAAAGVPELPEAVTGKQQHIYVSPDSKLSLKMNVEEINKVMKQLGASKLFPSSIDGKTITLESSPTVYYDVPLGENTISGSLSQTRVPSVALDDTADVQEALDAVIQFPLLPQQLKTSLQQSQFLTTGEIPLPVFTESGAQSEQVAVGQTKVLLNTRHYQNAKQIEATWVKDGVLYNYNVYFNKEQAATEEQFRTKLQELVEA